MYACVCVGVWVGVHVWVWVLGIAVNAFVRPANTTCTFRCAGYEVLHLHANNLVLCNGTLALGPHQGLLITGSNTTLRNIRVVCMEPNGKVCHPPYLETNVYMHKCTCTSAHAQV